MAATAPAGWTLEDAPDLTGRRAVVTGANRGLGLVLSEALVSLGVDVVLACRDPAAGSRAVSQVAGRGDGADVQVVPLDLAEPQSIHAAADAIAASGPPVDLLLNNAAAILPPAGFTTEGIEVAFATNHLGHFALAARLCPAFAPGARVVTMSSLVHAAGRLDGDDLAGSVTRAPALGPWRAYARSKLANLVFTAEWQRRIDAAGVDLLAVAAHPGHATSHDDQAEGRQDDWWLRPFRPVLDRVGQPAADAVLPALRAAVDPAVTGGSFAVPSGARQRAGPPVLVPLPDRAADPVLGERLWAASEQLTGVRFDLAP